MTGTRRPEPPQHMSHSAKETLERCAKSYFLKYFTDAPRRPAVWSVGGSAVHEVTEEYDRAALKAQAAHIDVSEAWTRRYEALLGEAREREPNENAWGQSRAEPVEVWRGMGPGLVQGWIDWRGRSPWEIWTTPDGDPAIELEVSGRLPGCPVEVKAYVDRIMYDPVFDRHVVVDLKSGKRPPKSAAQFETYKALIQVKYGLECELGTVFMNRTGGPGRTYDLREVTPAEVGAVFGEAWKKVQAGDWTADTSDCYICDVSASCYAKNGPLAAQYDPAHPKHPDYSGLEPPPF